MSSETMASQMESCDAMRRNRLDSQKKTATGDSLESDGGG
jgi:hypothetical protein